MKGGKARAQSRRHMAHLQVVVEGGGGGGGELVVSLATAAPRISTLPSLETLFSRSFFEAMGLEVEEPTSKPEAETTSKTEAETTSKTEAETTSKTEAETTSKTEAEPEEVAVRFRVRARADKTKAKAVEEEEESRYNGQSLAAIMARCARRKPHPELDSQTGMSYLEKEKVVLDIQAQIEYWNCTPPYLALDTDFGHKEEEDAAGDPAAAAAAASIYLLCGRYVYLSTAGVAPLQPGEPQSARAVHGLLALLAGARGAPGTLLWKLGR